MKEERKHRSESYQWLILETPIDMSNNSTISNTFDSENHLYAPFQKQQEIEELDHDLLLSLMLIVIPKLSPKQKFVMECMMKGMAQMDIVKVYNKKFGNIAKSNSSINRVITGNLYKTKNNKRVRAGGLFNKIKFTALQSNDFRLACQSLHLHIESINYPNSTVTLHLVRSWFDNLEDYLDWLELPILPNGQTVWKEEEIKREKQHYLTLFNKTSAGRRCRYTQETIKGILTDCLSTKEKAKKYKVSNKYIWYICSTFYV